MCPNIYVIGAQSTGKTTLVDALQAHFLSKNHCCEEEEEKGRQKEDNTQLAASHSKCHHHHPVVVSEVARKLLEERSWKGDTITASAESALALQKLIIHAQGMAEHEAISAILRPAPVGAHSCHCCQSQNPAVPCFLISDRSAIDAIVYARQYAGLQESRGLMELPEWREMRQRMAGMGSLVVLCEPNPSWLVGDGVRFMPRDEREWLATHRLFVSVLKEAGVPFVVLAKEVDHVADRVDFVLEHMQRFIDGNLGAGTSN